ncbi:hypothetical protein [Spirosoma fluminis]
MPSPNTDFVVSYHVDEVLTIDAAPLTRWQRWQLIAEIDQYVDRYQRCLNYCRIRSETHQLLSEKLRALRLKRFQVWNSFYPAYQRAIKIGFYAV